MQLNDFRKNAHDVVDWMADYLENVDQNPVRPSIKFGTALKALPASPPRRAESWEQVFEDFKEIVVPGMMHWQHPGFFGYFPANSSPPSVLAEMLTATLGAQCMSWETSPAATELEIRVMEWLRELLGLPEDFVGSIQDTASTATLVALLCARQRASGDASNATGVESNLTVYCSSEAHSSIRRAVRIIGIGDARLREIPVADDQSMSAEALSVAMAEDRSRGMIPAAVVACLGTTGTSGFDSVAEIGAVCAAHQVWLHVDAAWAGSALVLPEHRWMIEGIEHADSFVVNPHKWLFTNFDCSTLFVRDPEQLIGTMSILPEYLKTAEVGATNYRDWGIQLGRRFRALKLWCVLRCYGVEGLQKIIAQHIEWSHELAQQIDREPDFEVVRKPVLSLFCFRYLPSGATEEETDDLNRRLLTAVNASGKVYLTHTNYHGRFVIRFVAGQTQTTRDHVLSVLSCFRTAIGSVVGN